MAQTQLVPFVDQWTRWLATDAPRRLIPATIQEYRRHLLGFADWVETTLGITFVPDQITANRMERYLAELEVLVRSKQRRHCLLYTSPSPRDS